MRPLNRNLTLIPNVPYQRRGFTLIELMSVLVIVSILLAMSSPLLGKIRERAESTACASNLRQIWICLELATQENNNTYPIIEPSPNNPVYDPEMGARTLAEVLTPYGANEKILTCPADLRSGNRFATLGTSYEWRPVVDGESAMAPQIYTRRGVRMANLSRLRLLMDADPVHRGKHNILYADGHIRLR